MKNKFIYLSILLSSMLLSACWSTGGGSKPSGDDPGGEPAELIFSEAKFASLEFTYDGTPHILGEVTGVPEGTKITYTGLESHIDAGTYGADAKLEKEGYKTKNLHADLFIMRAKFPTYEYKSVTLTYDGNNHFDDIKFICDNIPDNTTYDLKVKYNGEYVTEAIDAGAYEFKLVVTNHNYDTLNLTAHLIINEKEFSGYTYKDVTVKYDGEDHINDIKLTGGFPEGTYMDQIVQDSNYNIVTSCINPGIYHFVMIIDFKNYKNTTLTATLTITE